MSSNTCSEPNTRSYTKSVPKTQLTSLAVLYMTDMSVILN